MPRRLAVPFALLALLLFAVPSAQAALTWSARETVSGSVDDPEPSAYGAGGGDVVAAWTRQRTQYANALTATRSGGTWTTEPVAVPNDAPYGGTAPRVAVAANGDALVTYERSAAPPASRHELVASFRPKGGGWSAPQVLESTFTNFDPVADPIATAGGGFAVAYAAVDDDSTSPSYGEASIAVRRAAAGALAFGSATRVHDVGSVIDNEYPTTTQTAELPDGRLAVAWSEARYDSTGTGANDFPVRAAVEAADGTWPAAQRLSTVGATAWQPQLAAGSDGTLAVGWMEGAGSGELQVAAKGPADAAFGAAHGLGQASQTTSAGSFDGTEPAAHSLGVGPSGEIVVVWHRFDGLGGYEAAGARRSGGAWSAAQRLGAAQDRPNEGGPFLAMASDGRAVVTWGSLDSKGLLHTWVEIKPAGQAFPSAGEEVANAGNETHPYVAVTGGEITLMSFGIDDGLPQTQHVYARSTPLPGAGPPPADTASPQISLTTPPLGKATYTQGQVAKAAYTCTDDVAVASCTGPVANGANVPTGTVGTNIPFKVTAVDSAGHTTTVTHFYDVKAAPVAPPAAPVDRTPPTISITSPLNGAPLYFGAPVDAVYSCRDETRLVSCVGTIPSGQRVTRTTGKGQTLTVTARDAAGNTATKSVRYDVATPAQVNQPLPAPLKQAAKPVLDAVKKTPSTSSSTVLKGGLPATINAPANSDLGTGLLGSTSHGLISDNGLGIMSDNGLGLISDNGLGLRGPVSPVVASGGGNVVAAGGANRLALRTAGAAAVRKPKPKAKVVLLARASRHVTKAGKVKLKLKLSKAGKALVKKTFGRKGLQKVKLVLALGMVRRGSGLPPVIVLKTITIKEPKPRRPKTH